MGPGQAPNELTSGRAGETSLCPQRGDVAQGTGTRALDGDTHVCSPCTSCRLTDRGREALKRI